MEQDFAELFEQYILEALGKEGIGHFPHCGLYRSTGRSTSVACGPV